MTELLPTPTPEDARTAAFAYAVGLVTGVFCLWFYADRPFVRFHAWQSTLLWIVVGLTIAGLDLVPIVGGGLALTVFLGAIALTAFLLWRSWRGDWLALPLLGDVAREQAVGRG